MDIFSKHPQWDEVLKICKRLKDSGFTAWLAGGCVRDGLLGIIPQDFDVATDAKPHEVQALFSKTVDVGKAFGVIRVVTGAGEDIEVATFRRDGAYIDGRHPTSVESSTPEQDAQRRDFTINALFYDPFDKKIHDFVQGQDDLKKTLIRAVGIAHDRFVEDKLRILRAVRFVAQLDFRLDKETLKAASALAPEIKAVSYERIHDELSKLFCSKSSAKGVKLMQASGLMQVIFPLIDPANLKYLEKFEKLDIEKFDAKKSEEHRLLKMRLGWMSLLAALPGEVAQISAMKELKFSNEERALTSQALKIASILPNFWSLAQESLRWQLAAEPASCLAYEFFLLDHEDKDEKIGKFFASHSALPMRIIKSKDVMALGIKAGKELGQILEEAFIKQLNGEIKDKAKALEWLKLKIKKD